MRSRYSAALVLALSGCAFDTSPNDACGFLSGTFEITYAELPGGTCGPTQRRVAVPEDVPTACAQSVRYTDRCAVHVERSCPGIELEYWLNKTATGFVGKAEASSPGCFSVYDVVLVSLVPE